MYVNMQQIKKEYINKIEAKYQLVKRKGIKQNLFRNHDVYVNFYIKVETQQVYTDLGITNF